MSAAISPHVLEAWLTARSTARGVPAPVHDRGGLRVDTASDAERCRYVFLEADGAFRAAAEAIDTPLVFLKACASEAAVLALAPPRWRVQSIAWMMTQDPQRDDCGPPLPAGYVLDVTTSAGVTTATVVGSDGAVAASGHAAASGGVYCYDRIKTEPAHYRRGLGRAVMAALGLSQPAETLLRMLAATDAGRALYTTLGWRVIAPYTTIEIPLV